MIVVVEPSPGGRRSVNEWPRPAFLVSAVVMAAGAATLWRWPLQPQTGTDLQYSDDAAAVSGPRPRTDHYLAAEVRE